MPRFEADHFFPRLSGGDARTLLVKHHGKPADEIAENSIDLKRAEFHPAASRHIDEPTLLAWRQELNDWAWDEGFPSPMNTERRSTWDVELGRRLLDDLKAVPELLHPNVWCWLASSLLPHFVVHRWGWPAEKDGEPPTGRGPWARFGADHRNGLRLAMQRIMTYGDEITARASEQEFQSLLNRPAFGSDPRVAKVIMETFIRSLDDPTSNYGKNGGTRALDCNIACIELRLLNSLRPFCFATDESIVDIVNGVIDRLPELRGGE